MPVKSLKIGTVRRTRADLDLHPIGLEVAIVEPSTALEHGDHALAGLLALDEGSDVRVIATLAAADEATRGHIRAETSTMEEFTISFGPRVRLAMGRRPPARMRLELRALDVLEKLTTTLDVPGRFATVLKRENESVGTIQRSSEAGLGDTVGKHVAASAAVAASPESGAALLDGDRARAIAAAVWATPPGQLVGGNGNLGRWGSDVTTFFYHEF